MVSNASERHEERIAPSCEKLVHLLTKVDHGSRDEVVMPPVSHEMRNEVNSSTKLFLEAVCKGFRSQVTRKEGRGRLCEHGEAIEW